MESTRIIIALNIALAGAGCASTSGTKPHDMSVASHEQAAMNEEQASAQHGQQYNADATASTQHCGRGACWTSVSNPTEQHQQHAAEHKKVAAEHRAAAQALRDAEASACAGLDEADIATSPFYHREDISEVARVPVSTQQGRHLQNDLVGGRVVFRAVPGMTTEWLQRLVDCHTARAAAVGYAMPEMAYCPLALKGVKATVSSTGTGFAIEMTSDDSATDAEIWRRVQALNP